jgi:ATP-dependent DNA helicase RecG
LDSTPGKSVSIPGLTARRRELLGRLGLFSEEDLIGFFPRDYEDWTAPKPVTDLIPNDVGTFVAVAQGKPSLRHKGRMSILKATFRDPTGTRVFATWFNQPYYQDKIESGQSYLLRGKIRINGFVAEIVNPVFEVFHAEDQAGIKPVYRLTAGLTQGVIRKLVASALVQSLPNVQDCLPDAVRRTYKLCSARYAYEKIHLPRKTAKNSRWPAEALAFDELFMIQAGLRLVKSTVVRREKAFSAALPRRCWHETFYTGLPFVLTDAQQKVVDEILTGPIAETPMNQADSGGCGIGQDRHRRSSTCMMPTAWDAGYPDGSDIGTSKSASCDHDPNFLPAFSDQYRATDRKRLQERNGKKSSQASRTALILLLIGTHAVLEDTVRYQRLALAITDEQHRFGVKQRSRLGKGVERSPHVLVLSATPIPRTLGFVLYGDLDISTVRGMPGGRMPIETYTATTADDARIHRLMDRQIEEGRQIYVVCPMIEATMESDLLSVKELYEEMSGRLFVHRRTGLLHGAMTAKEKNAVMDDFMAGALDILVSTTVIEVGVDNPNASIMLIQNAERFGLAQLHQLRGRIGRGPHKSICILKSDSDQEAVRERLKTLCKHSDGFEIAEKDLALRGMGDFFGTRQHGIPELKIANLYRDTEILEESREAVLSILREDPLLEKPENRSIVVHIRKRFGGMLDNIGL